MDISRTNEGYTSCGPVVEMSWHRAGVLLLGAQSCLPVPEVLAVEKGRHGLPPLVPAATRHGPAGRRLPTAADRRMGGEGRRRRGEEGEEEIGGEEEERGSEGRRGDEIDPMLSKYPVLI
uniref:Uncharacterized protein n=1 Tax=Oryza sativa subsp. japonica TaxID=39947 RepID=Q7XHZ9_ORYSJ|nr:hypothetical protein [Oryza sativa Japonica Group]BAC84403.1 hypothetical protein [Oryza sativa Japonica Group]